MRNFCAKRGLLQAAAAAVQSAGHARHRRLKKGNEYAGPSTGTTVIFGTGKKRRWRKIIAIKPITAANAAPVRRGAFSSWFMRKTLSAVAVHRCFSLPGSGSLHLHRPETDGREIGLIIDLKALPKEVQTLGGAAGTALFCAPHPQS